MRTNQFVLNAFKGVRRCLSGRLLLPGLLFVAGFSFTSCKPTRSLNFFDDFPRDTVLNISRAQSVGGDTIQVGDYLDIRISSLNEMLDKQFQKSGGNEMNPSALGQLQSTSDEGFPVDANGLIHLHFLGKIKVAGMTKLELKSRLENDLQPFMKDPIASVRFMNKKVTIIGEVKSPKILSLQDDRINLIDALVASGDLTENALIQDLMIIREHGQTTQIKHMNLNDKDIFQSPWFILQHNDVVYVKKDWNKAGKLDRIRSLQMNISMIVSLITLVTVVLNNLIR